VEVILRYLAALTNRGSTVVSQMEDSRLYSKPVALCQPYAKESQESGLHLPLKIAGH